MKRINSKAKGDRGEREAAKYLARLGFEGARRSQQYNGRAGLADVVCPDLPDLHIEVKYLVTGMDFGTKLFREACQQAKRDAKGKDWCVLWKRKGCRQWLLTVPFRAHYPTIATFAHDQDIAHRLRVLHD